LRRCSARCSNASATSSSPRRSGRSSKDHDGPALNRAGRRRGLELAVRLGAADPLPEGRGHVRRLDIS
jgi:hypothetical protein